MTEPDPAPPTLPTGQSGPAQTYPAQVFPAQPYATEPHPAQPRQDVAWTPQGPTPQRPRRRRTGLIVSIVLGVLLVLCGGGGVGAFLLIENAQPRGTAEPKAAVQGFLTAVFSNHDAQEAATFVCPAARDDKQLARLVFDVKAFEKNYSGPRTTWNDPLEQVTGRQASATVKLTLRTANEQVAEKQIRLLLVEDRGWWVCDVESVG